MDEPDRPVALILFSGRSRPGDLRSQLVNLGWLVCSVDTVSPTPTDLLSDGTWEAIIKDIKQGFFTGLWIATPCHTFSPLREKPPGPRPLRSVQKIEGFAKEDLTQAEHKQFKEANILVDRSAEAASAQDENGMPWGLENPLHDPEKPQLWMMPKIQQLANRRGVREVVFDQCRTGLTATKPTKLLFKMLDLNELNGLRCNHTHRTFTRKDGTTYRAAHESTVQKWVTGPDGRGQRASKAQGEYTPELSELLAMAFHHTLKGSPWLKLQLQKEPIP